jgi:hypothetical protein
VQCLAGGEGVGRDARAAIRYDKHPGIKMVQTPNSPAAGISAAQVYDEMWRQLVPN